MSKYIQATGYQRVEHQWILEEVDGGPGLDIGEFRKCSECGASSGAPEMYFEPFLACGCRLELSNDCLIALGKILEHLPRCPHRDQDPRKKALKRGLDQLTSAQICRLLAYDGPIQLDDVNYSSGVHCPLSIALGLPEIMKRPTNTMVTAVLGLLGYDVYNTRGVKGEFYTTNRREDLMTAAREVLEEREDIPWLGVPFASTAAWQRMQDAQDADCHPPEMLEENK